MQIPRFFVVPAQLKVGASSAEAKPFGHDSFKALTDEFVTILEPALINQVKNVLRLRPDDHLILLDGQGSIVECKLLETAKSEVRCQIVGKTCEDLSENIEVTIGLPLLKGERFDFALQKLTEVGVAKIVPITTARTVVKIAGDDAKGISKKLARWQAITREAAEQCERVMIPQIVLPMRIEEFLATFASGGMEVAAFICAERLPEPSLKDILLELRKKILVQKGTAGKTISIVVGPEGGLTSDEIQFAQERGWKAVSLGRRILRSETAAIYAVAQIIWALEK
jgi:16S rRNA (uracil1498-N3)-methyltransferase